MIDWSNYNTPPTPATLNSYPTALAILKDIVAMEEEEQLYKMPLRRRNGDYFYDWSRKGSHLAIRPPHPGAPQLMPLSRTPWTLYRGQSKYYERCLPSLYRFEEEQLDYETLRSYLQLSEMTLVMWTHPVIRTLVEGSNMHFRIGPVCFSIEYEGLAQHYGIKTNYLDLTNDIWTAIFFATTEFDRGCHAVSVNDSSEFSDRYGVLYRLNYSNYLRNFPEIPIAPIGLQYFNRPGRQCAFVIDMKDYKDLHNLPDFERVYFRHDNDANKLIFTLTQFGKQYFPDDTFADVVAKICSQNKFSDSSVRLTRDLYYDQKNLDEFIREVKDAGFEITLDLNASFPKDVTDKEYEEWMCGGLDRYVDSIIIQKLIRSEYNESRKKWENCPPEM